MFNRDPIVFSMLKASGIVSVKKSRSLVVGAVKSDGRGRPFVVFSSSIKGISFLKPPAQHLRYLNFYDLVLRFHLRVLQFQLNTVGAQERFRS